VPLVHAHDLTAPGVVMQDGAMKVTSAVVSHPLVKDAYAYRFDAPDRSIVISGDTTRSANLVKLAEGADVLVHEALYPEAIDRIVARVPNAATLKKHILESHTTAEDCGRIAAEAGVKTLVLSHLAPSDPSLVTEAMWADAARRHFSGRVVVGRDLMEL
jgi:ribonuclease BN (tRNA processing enzyme)